MWDVINIYPKGRRSGKGDEFIFMTSHKTLFASPENT